MCPDLCFFQRATEYPCVEIQKNAGNFESLRKRVASTALKVESRNPSHLSGRLEFQSNMSTAMKSIDEYQRLTDGNEAHWEVVERILFIYSKLNSGQGYVQGMNEIIGPIYYTFATDPNVEWRGKLSRYVCSVKLV